ncbi:homocysteine S-methyltransferase family protein [Candidatus Peregrinibacteria bacterium]|nr:homocysteine S-methyltransferase family protein [Candidatus Peregrinibacteria bacterium]
MSLAPKTLFGPHGTLLEDEERKTGIIGLADPKQILNGPRYRDAVISVARSYIDAGARVAATNTFRVRHVLDGSDPSRIDRYRAIVRGHLLALQTAIDGIDEEIIRVISLGPAGDCYKPHEAPDRLQAEEFHGYQASTVAQLDVDFAWFETVNTIEEAVGIAIAAKKAGVRCVISFVIDSEGDLLSGESIYDAIREIDGVTNNYPFGFGLNCCPIEGIQKAMQKCGSLRHRIIAVYPNASSFPPNELSGKALHDHVLGVVDPDGVAAYLHGLARENHLQIIGGCCGFTPKDIAKISHAVRHGIIQSNIPRTDKHRG